MKRIMSFAWNMLRMFPLTSVFVFSLAVAWILSRSGIDYDSGAIFAFCYLLPLFISTVLYRALDFLVFWSDLSSEPQLMYGLLAPIFDLALFMLVRRIRRRAKVA